MNEAISAGINQFVKEAAGPAAASSKLAGAGKVLGKLLGGATGVALPIIGYNYATHKPGGGEAYYDKAMRDIKYTQGQESPWPRWFPLLGSGPMNPESALSKLTDIKNITDRQILGTTGELTKDIGRKRQVIQRALESQGVGGGMQPQAMSFLWPLLLGGGGALLLSKLLS